MTTVNAQMQQRRDTAANWTSGNPVLLAGEIGLETDTQKLKVGDGTTAWNSLGYWFTSGGGLTFTEVNGTELVNIDPADGDWHDVDVSAEAPNSIAVALSWRMYSTASDVLWLRKNGSTLDGDITCVGQNVAYIPHRGYISFMPVDDNQIFEYKVSDSVVSSLKIYLLGYWS